MSWNTLQNSMQRNLFWDEKPFHIVLSESLLANVPTVCHFPANLPLIHCSNSNNLRYMSFKVRMQICAIYLHNPQKVSCRSRNIRLETWQLNMTSNCRCSWFKGFLEFSVHMWFRIGRVFFLERNWECWRRSYLHFLEHLRSLNAKLKLEVSSLNELLQGRHLKLIHTEHLQLRNHPQVN